MDAPSCNKDLQFATYMLLAALAEKLTGQVPVVLFGGEKESEQWSIEGSGGRVKWKDDLERRRAWDEAQEETARWLESPEGKAAIAATPKHHTANPKIPATATLRGLIENVRKLHRPQDGSVDAFVGRWFLNAEDRILLVYPTGERPQ